MAIDWSVARSIREPSFESCMMEGSQFLNMNLCYIKFNECRLGGSDFSGANLSNAEFKDANLESVIFDQTNLEDADLRGARDYYFSPSENKVKGLKVDRNEAVNLLHIFKMELF